MVEEEEKRLVMTGSVCLDKFMVDTDRLSASRERKNTVKRQWSGKESKLSFEGYSTLLWLNVVMNGKTTNMMLEGQRY